MANQSRAISLIGGGRMGEALIRGLIRSGASRSSITVYDRSAERLKTLASELGITAASSTAEAVAGADAVIIAVKPKDVPSALRDLNGKLDKAVLISIAAGVSSARIAGLLSGKARIVRAMPNAPAGKGAGITAIAAGPGATPEDVANASEIFDAVGLVTEVPEKDMNAVTAISGSGPAYFYYFIKAVTDAGVKLGLKRETAYELAHETMFGASRMLKYSNKSVEELIDEVKSPGGTTAAALEAFGESDLAGIIESGIAEAARRAAELEEQTGNEE